MSHHQDGTPMPPLCTTAHRVDNRTTTGNNSTMMDNDRMTAQQAPLPLVFKGPVQSSFLTSEGVNHGPRLVQCDAQITQTETELNRTGPIQFG
jgi:hypothetical protein